MRRSKNVVRCAVAISVALALAFTGLAAADPADLAPAASYNSAQGNLVTGKYVAGLSALDTLAATFPSDSNVAALQVFYSNSSGDIAGLTDATARLTALDPAKAELVDRALGIIDTVATTPVDYAPVFDGAKTAIVVLGFGLEADGTMRPAFVKRVQAGLDAATASPESPIIVTGGNPRNGISEGDAMNTWLVAHGVAADRIHVEGKANSTPQNAVFSTQMLKSIGADNIVVATSPDHIRRATSDFEIAGSTVVGAVSPDAGSPPTVPSLAENSRLGLTIDATKVIGIPRTY